METLRLLVTELVTNSVRHTRSPTRHAEDRRRQSAVLTEVTDEGPGLRPALQTERPGTTTRGWGLFLVERLADRWGVTHDGAPRSGSGSSCSGLEALLLLEAELLALARRRLSE